MGAPRHISPLRGLGPDPNKLPTERWILVSCIIDKLYVLGVSFKEGAWTISGSYFSSLRRASFLFCPPPFSGLSSEFRKLR